jgi:hypothetical protein
MTRILVISCRLRISAFSKSTQIASHHRLLSSFATPPSPPRLPKEEQEIFEELQRKSTGAFSTPRSDTTQTKDSKSSGSDSSMQPSSISTSPTSPPLETQIKVSGEGDELHPHIRRGAPPEFKGETNPKTGEVNGPKNEPLRWGASGDYSYNGRVTDF